MDSNAPPSRPTIEQLRHVANGYPVIDHHAHNLILPTYSETIPFETVTTEAQGRALRDTFKSLSHLRAARQLRQLYECGEDSDWEDILEQRTEWLRSDPDKLHQRCFEGVHALLIDDGLTGPEKIFPYEHHDKYTKAPCKRIVRIETVAERLMERIIRKTKEDDLSRTRFLPDTWVAFSDGYERAIQDAIEDPEVAGFKTVICYRTGLDIEPEYEEAAKAVGHPFERFVKNCVRKRNYRVEKKALNDYIVLRTLEILLDRVPHPDSFSKPLQFHTGLGDNDISLLESNPAFLQPLIENYPTVPFVLLHSAHPYTREAGYLATVYRHVYLGIGGVFPMLSRDGQEVVLRQAMELVPGSKLMYSSDGHWFPETFWLANFQFRQVWVEVLLDYVQKGDLTPFQAMGMTKDILFNNANTLYDLHYEAIFDDRVPELPRQLTFNPNVNSSSLHESPIGLPVRDAGTSDRRLHLETPVARPVSPYPQSFFPPPPKVPQVYDIDLLEKFRQDNARVYFVYIQWVDYVATVRTRTVPMKEFQRMIRAGERIEVSQRNRYALQEPLKPIADNLEQIYVEPDLRSLRITHKKDPLPSATVLCYWRDESGSPLPKCPRTSLEALVSNLQYNFSTMLHVSFDIEVTFLSRNSADPSESHGLQDKSHIWSPMSTEQFQQLPLLSEIALALGKMEIDVQQFHAESGKGQCNFTLAPLPVLSAVDTLMQARQAISQIAAQHDLHATFYSNPLKRANTAANIQIRLQPADRDMQFFVGGVLQHLPAICALSMPGETSYAHNVDSHRSTWLAWGTRNRQTPLRRISPGHWEIRTLDSHANIYLALASMTAAGLLGLQSAATEFPQQDVPFDPSTLDEEARKHYGIVRMLPRSLPEALDALQSDTALKEAMTHDLIADYISIHESELEASAPKRGSKRERTR